VLPGYDGRNKTFFFTNIDYTRIRSGTVAGFGNTTPIDAFKAGDFSALLTNNQIGVDALGPADLQRADLRSATTRLVNGVPVRDPFPGNRIPEGHPLRSQVASRIVPLMVGPDRGGLANNVAGLGTGDQTWELDARNIMFRIDHNVTPNFRANHSFYWNRRPSVRNCEGVDGCNYEFNPEKEPEKNTEYYGSGFFQRISTHHAHQQFDWIISNNLLNHSTIAWDRWFMGGNHLSAGANWPQRLWQGTANPTGGIVAQDAGPPDDAVQRRQHSVHADRPRGLAALRLREERPLAVLERPHVGEGTSHAEDRLRVPLPQLPAARLGGGRTAGNFNFNRLGTAGYDAAGNNLQATGDPFASFLLGQVHQSESEPLRRADVERDLYGVWVNDEFKVSDKLTLTLGLRFDYQSARTEVDDQYSTFSPTTPNPGAGGIPGAIIFAGDGPGRAGSANGRTCRRTPGGRASASRTAPPTAMPSAAAMASTTRTSRSASSARRRRRASRPTRSRRT
jgi:hypothetical protein